MQWNNAIWDSWANIYILGLMLVYVRATHRLKAIGIGIAVK